MFDLIGQKSFVQMVRSGHLSSAAAAASQANNFPALLSEREPPHIPRSFALREVPWEVKTLERGCDFGVHDQIS